MVQTKRANWEQDLITWEEERKSSSTGQEEEGSRSNRPELVAFLLALRDTPKDEPLLYLQVVWQSVIVEGRQEVDWWDIGEGGKATLAGAPDAEILTTVIDSEILRKRIVAGTATFLVKIKASRGKPANKGQSKSAPRKTDEWDAEGADILVDKAISDPKVGNEGCQRTNRAVSTWNPPCRKARKVTYQDRHSTLNNSVRDAIRRGAASVENEVPKYEERLKGAWRQVLGDKWAHWYSGDDMKDGIKVMT